MKPKLLSLFAGAGGLDVGLERAGFETVFANEIEPYACETLRTNRVLRSLRPAEFEGWFEHQVSRQRCYRHASHHEIARLKNRLFAAVDDPTHCLERAHIAEMDVRALSAEMVFQTTGLRRGELDLIAGGPPCQPFSRAGKRELVDCEKGQLFQEFVRLVTALQPRWFLFENVKGLVIHQTGVAELHCRTCGHSELSEFSHREALKDAVSVGGMCRGCGRTGLQEVRWTTRRAGSLEIIENEFQRAGYHCRSVVLNAADFGAPQLRERLFIVGSRDAESFTFPQPTHSEGISAVPSLFDKLAPGRPPWRTVAQALYSGGHWKYGALDPERAALWVKNVVRPHDEPVTWTLDRPAPTVGAHQAAKLAIAPEGVPDEQLFRQQWHVLGRRQGDTSPVRVEHEYLTDEELLKLQTLPTSWYLHGTRMERAFQIGNAVPPVLAEAVGREIMTAMNLSGPVLDQQVNYAHAASI